MWQWLLGHSILVLAISVLFIVLGVLFKNIIPKKIKGETEPNKPSGGEIAGQTIFWSAEFIAWAMVAVSLVAVMFSRKETADLITLETVGIWIGEHGIPVFLMLLFGFVLWFGMNRFLPPFITRIVYRAKQGESLQGMKKRANTLTRVFLSLGKSILVIIILLMVLSEIGINIGPILAGFGIAGVAVGFGAQYLIRDLIAGVFIIAENQYRIGDVVGIAGYTATVEELNLRKTVLRDIDGVVHHIPNGEIKIASNFTRHFARVKLDIPVSYSTNLEHAMAVINRVGQELAADDNWKDKILTPPQAIRVNNLGNSGIDIRVLGDCKPMEQWAIMGEMRLRLKKAFDQEGIEIPWPHLKVYFGKPDVP